MIPLYRKSTEAQVGHAQAVIARSCDMIVGRYGFYTAGWVSPVPQRPDQRLRAGLASVVAAALASQDGVEGGIWQAESGSLAYTCPTYQRTGPKVAGVAHEIRNKIAAARLQGENALASDDQRRRQAISEMLRQIDRLGRKW